MTGRNSTRPARRTVRGTAQLEGVGIHTGATSRVTFRGAACGAGVTFVRTDLDGAPAIPARLDAVSAV